MAIDQAKQAKGHWVDVEAIVRDGEIMSKMEKGEDPSIKAISLDVVTALQKSRKI